MPPVLHKLETGNDLFSVAGMVRRGDLEVRDLAPLPATPPKLQEPVVPRSSNPKKAAFLTSGIGTKLSCRKQEDELFLAHWAFE